MTPEQKERVKAEFGACNDKLLDAAYAMGRESMGAGSEGELRAKFEHIASKSPYSRDIRRMPKNSNWPGQYKDIDVQFAWDMFLAASGYDTGVVSRLRKLIPSCDCADPTGCFEPCGDLGHDERFAKIATSSTAKNTKPGPKPFNRAKLVCETCFSQFEVKGCLEGVRKYCSRQCYKDRRRSPEGVKVGSLPYACLASMSSFGNRTATALAKVFDVPYDRVRTALTRLEQDGNVERDGATWAITKDGEALLSKLRLKKGKQA